MLGAVIGALLPDLSLYLLAGTALFILRLSPQRVFDELYFSDTWQTMFAIDNSFLVWGAGLALALWWRAPAGIAMAAAGLLHLALDLPLHAGDGRAHFWPLTRWVFDSPVSYWDSTHHAMWVAPVAAALCLTCYTLLWRSGIGLWAKAGFGALVAAELWVASQWILHF